MTKTVKAKLKLDRQEVTGLILHMVKNYHGSGTMFPAINLYYIF